MNWRTAVFCVLGGLPFSVAGLADGHANWWWLAGILISASVVPVVQFGPIKFLAQCGVIASSIVIVGIWCTLSEGAIFYPESRAKLFSSFVGGTALYVVDSAWLAGLAGILKLHRPAEERMPLKSAPAVAGLLLVSGIAYLVYYYLFGMLAFVLYTKQFYPHAAEQVAALGAWFPLYQVGRGVLMTLAMLPMIATLRTKRWQAALIVGLMAWIVGGAAPLLVPSPQMAATQRYAHIFEIMTQNVSLGITAVWLLRRNADYTGADDLR